MLLFACIAGGPTDVASATFGDRFRRGNSGVWIALGLLLLFASLRYDAFLSEYNLLSFLNYNSMFVLISLGMCFVIISGGIDLSVGSVVALSSVAAAHVSAYGLLAGLPAGIAVGICIGLINALMIVRLRVAPFIATLATMLGGRGLALVLADNQTVAVSWDSNFTSLGMEKVFDLAHGTTLIALAVCLCAWLLLEKMPFGRYVLAVGGGQEASRYMGLKVDRTVALVYVFSGACAGLAGVFLASGFGAGQPLEGIGWELSAIAAAVVGGTLLTGGKGSVPATVAGALLLGLIFNILNFENGRGVISLSAYWQSVIRGGFLLLVILFQAHLLNKQLDNR